ncbi:MAG TPA: ATP-binding protein [Candidatus Limnocylindria bacterium]|nr:ATP-binding protein [Candidatus Limnocylindria bacterium]
MLGRLEWLFADRWRLPLLVGLLIALPILVLGELSAADTRERLRSEQIAAANATAIRAGDQIRAHADGVGLQILLAIGVGSLSTGLASADNEIAADFVRRSRKLMTAEVARLMVLDTSLRLRADDPAAGVVGDRPTIDPDFLFLIQRGISGELPGYSAVYRSDSPGHPPVVATGVAAFALSRDAFTRGYLIAELDLARVLEWLVPVVASGDDLYIVDTKGRLITHTAAPEHEALHDLSGDPVIAAVLARRPLPVEADDPLGGGHRFVASRAVPQLGWYVLTMRSTGAVGNQVEATLTQLLFSRLLLVLVLLAGSILMASTASAVLRQRDENALLVREVRDTSTQLEIASRHKSEFLANMSHELRTPLNAIIGFSDVLKQGMVGDLNEKQREYIDDVLGSARHLLALINDILDLSKVEAGRMELELSTFSLSDAVENGVTMVRDRATRGGVVLVVDVAPDIGEIQADERKVKQVLFNLLTNAVKFTRSGGRVAVSARREDEGIRVFVQDTGIGIAPSEQDRIFDEFHQVSSAKRVSAEGTGLGLALTKRFVELHGGRIWVESTPDAGSTFVFTLPVRPAASPAPPEAAVR